MWKVSVEISVAQFSEVQANNGSVLYAFSFEPFASLLLQ